ncbi:MAG: CoA-binding protein, partial [Patescibacteria group bacterium]
YVKFLKYVRDTSWRENIASMNYLLTSTVWRQEHNGFSHQNPSFISGMLEKQNDFIKVYFPIDENTMLAVISETLSSKNQINTIVAGKTPLLNWLSFDKAKEFVSEGLGIWDFASDQDPDIVFVGIGDYVTHEALAAIDILKKDMGELKVRFVNILKLTAGVQIPNLEKYLTDDLPVIVNFHGYPEIMKSILFNVKNTERFSIHGYKELGGTTTPFDMQVRNQTDRYDLAIEALEMLAERGTIDKQKASELAGSYRNVLADHKTYIINHGKDPSFIENWQWRSKSHPGIDVDVIMHADVLGEAKTIAFIGLSDKPDRHSNQVASYFKSKGFRIIPINPNVSEVLGEKAYPDLLSIPKDIKIEIVDVFRNPAEVVPHLKEVLKRGGISTVWLQDGVSSREAEDFAEDFGISMVSNFCIMDAYKSLNKD